MRRVVLMLLTATILSTGILISTLARFTGRFTGEDNAMIAKWAFDVNVENGSFKEFNIFDGIVMRPMIESDEYVFNISGNGSDTAIDYAVKINIEDFNKIIGENSERFPGLMYISVNAPADNSITFTPSSANSGVSFINHWFYVEDCKSSDGSYNLNPTILTGTIEKGSTESISVTVKWQWNTSYFLSDEVISHLSSDSSGSNGYNKTTTFTDGKHEYYQSATLVYQNLINDKNQAEDALDDFKSAHSQWFSGGTDVDSTDAEGNVTTTHYPCFTDCSLSESQHESSYNSLSNSLRVAKQKVADSLKLVYDKYDTNVINGLNDNPLKIKFSVIGEQKEPQK